MTRRTGKQALHERVAPGEVNKLRRIRSRAKQSQLSDDFQEKYNHSDLDSCQELGDKPKGDEQC